MLLQNSKAEVLRFDMEVNNMIPKTKSAIAAVLLFVAANHGHAAMAEGYDTLLKKLPNSVKQADGVVLFFEMPTEKDLLKSIGSKGVDVVIAGDGTGSTTVRRYLKPNFADAQFVFEDSEISLLGGTSAAFVRRYNWFKRMALDFVAFEDNFGAEIGEIVGEEFSILKKDFSEAARKFNPKRDIPNKETLEMRFSQIKGKVEKGAVTESFREQMQRLEKLCAVLQIPATSVPDASEMASFADMLASITEKGAKESESEIEALNGYAKSRLFLIKDASNAKLAKFKNVGVPMTDFLSDAETIGRFLGDFPENLTEEEIGNIEHMVDKLAEAEAELDARRTECKKLLAHFDRVCESYDLAGYDFNKSEREKLDALFSILAEGKILSSKDWKEAERLISEADKRFAELERRKAELERRKADVKTFTASIQTELDEMREQGFDLEKLLGTGVEGKITALLSEGNISPEDFKEEQKRWINSQMGVAISRVSVAGESKDWIKSTMQRADAITNSIHTAINDVAKQIVGIGDIARRNQLYEWLKRLSGEVFAKLASMQIIMGKAVDAQSDNLFTRLYQKRADAEEAIHSMEQTKEYAVRELERISRDIEQQIMKEAVPKILARARNNAKSESSIEFYGFYPGMPVKDALILAWHYGLKKDEWECVATDSGKYARAFKFTLLGVRRISKSGDTYRELFQHVKVLLGMDGYPDDGGEVRTLGDVMARISQDDGLRIFYRNNGDPAKSVIGNVWEKTKESIDKADDLDLLGGALLLDLLF